MGSTSKSSRQGQARMTKPVRRASPAQILDLLSQRPMEIYKALGLEPKDANLSMPTDGRGARIRASVSLRDADSIPKRIRLLLEDRRLSVPIEVETDFQEFRPLVTQQVGASRSSGPKRD